MARKLADPILRFLIVIYQQCSHVQPDIVTDKRNIGDKLENVTSEEQDEREDEMGSILEGQDLIQTRYHFNGSEVVVLEI